MCGGKRGLLVLKLMISHTIYSIDDNFSKVQQFPSSGGVAKIQRIFDGVVITAAL